MATGTLIAESIRVGAVLDGPGFAVRELRRVEADLAPSQRAAGLPDRWTLVAFEVDDAHAAELACAMAAVLDEPGWYADLHTADRSFVVFCGRVVGYARDDAAGRAAA
ncbi:MAG: hypothetical protein QOH72_5619, partial [Solirubrobacteraceae bacterium]|nr:hypothetical protein [Solirubrobacteraceae bacterium]